MNYSIQNHHRNLKPPIRKILHHLFRLDLSEIHGKRSVGVIFVNDAAIAKLSKKFRGVDHATDVLSFSYDDHCIETAGEIIVSLDMAKRQAMVRSVSIVEELLMLITHGLLHLYGYDDVRASDRKRMRKAEFEALVKIL